MKLLAANLIWLLYKVWTSTWRCKTYESDEFKQLRKNQSPYVIAMWHGHEIALISFTKYYKVSTLVSTSSDGELMNQILNKMGVKTSRGSSTRGGTRALKGLIYHAKNNYIPLIPVDGPKGPIYKAKPGILQLSYLLKAPIVPCFATCSRAYIFKKSWNQAFLPKLFAQVNLYWGKPINPPKNSQEVRSLSKLKEIEDSIHAAGQFKSRGIAPQQSQ